MSNANLFAELDKDLHDLCQPLTAAAGYLELGRLRSDAGLIQEAMDKALESCRRMFESVATMRCRIDELRQMPEERP